jgi:hypothetical protein
MAAEFSALSNRADYYRKLAADIRERAASTKTNEARDALERVANDYELLAEHAESVASTWQTLGAAAGRAAAAEEKRRPHR